MMVLLMIGCRWRWWTAKQNCLFQIQMCLLKLFECFLFVNVTSNIEIVWIPFLVWDSIVVQSQSLLDYKEMVDWGGCGRVVGGRRAGVHGRCLISSCASFCKNDGISCTSKPKSLAFRDKNSLFLMQFDYNWLESFRQRRRIDKTKTKIKTYRFLFIHWRTLQ